MAFTYTWNFTFLATPADTEDESLGAQRIRDTKAAVGERLVVDHSLAGDLNDGLHKWVTLLDRESIVAQSLPASTGRLSVAFIDGENELFYQNSSGQIQQLTSHNAINATPAFPAGTSMVFVQSAPPAGWTLNPVLTDCTIRLVNDGFSGGTVGGSWTMTGLTAADHALSIGELPAHSHTEQIGVSGGGGFSAWTVAADGLLANAGYDTQQTGGGAGHSHTISSDGSWRPLYVNACVGVKS